MFQSGSRRANERTHPDYLLHSIPVSAIADEGILFCDGPAVDPWDESEYVRHDREIALDGELTGIEFSEDLPLDQTDDDEPYAL
jgi:hypothetical protein